MTTENTSLDARSTKLQYKLILHTRLGWLSGLNFRLGRHKAGKGDLCQCKQKCFDRDTIPERTEKIVPPGCEHGIEDSNFNSCLHLMPMLLIGLCDLIRPGKEKHISFLS